MTCDVIRGAFGKNVAGTMYILHNALKNSIKIHFWKFEINGCMMVRASRKKVLGVQVQCMLETNRCNF